LSEEVRLAANYSRGVDVSAPEVRIGRLVRGRWIRADGFAVAYLDGVAELLSGVVFGGDDQPPRT
jgi:hypothetical protein